jgi:hypothetical protein
MRPAIRLISIALIAAVPCAVGFGCNEDKEDPTLPVAGSGGTVVAPDGSGGMPVSSNDSATPSSLIDSGSVIDSGPDGASSTVASGTGGGGTTSISGTGGGPVAGTADASGDATPAGGADAGPITGDAAVIVPVDGGDAGSSTGVTLPGTVPINPPVPEGCITDVSAGDHTYTCDGIEMLVMVDQKCTQFACGLILDAHGGSMNGQWERDSTELHQLAPPEGFLTIHPTAPGGAWNYETHMPILADFMRLMINVFQVDQNRVHVTGFSMGSGVTFWFLCNEGEMLAGGGPVSGQSADQIVVVDTGNNCIQSIDATWQPRVPILFISGTQDTGLTEERARARTDGIVTRLGLTGGDVTDSGPGWELQHWEGDDGMVFDFIMHDWVGLLSGHCIPSGAGVASCFDTDPSFHWGRYALQWFIDHPKR